MKPRLNRWSMVGVRILAFALDRPDESEAEAHPRAQELDRIDATDRLEPPAEAQKGEGTEEN
jgi:hypothetical protein